MFNGAGWVGGGTVTSTIFVLSWIWSSSEGRLNDSSLPRRHRGPMCQDICGAWLLDSSAALHQGLPRSLHSSFVAVFYSLCIKEILPQVHNTLRVPAGCSNIFTQQKDPGIGKRILSMWVMQVTRINLMLLSIWRWLTNCFFILDNEFWCDFLPPDTPIFSITSS